MRDTKLDFFKGLLIWSVILGHCLNVFCPKENFLHMVLRTFDLPMFMYISGFLLKGSIARYEWKQLLLNKFTHIVIPAIVWMCISLLFGDHCMYYFLWAVFISSLIVCVCEKVSTKPWINVGLTLLAVVFFHIIPRNVINISFLFPFFLFGYYSKNITAVGWKKGVCFGVVYFFMCFCLATAIYNMEKRRIYASEHWIYAQSGVTSYDNWHGWDICRHFCDGEIL